MSPANHTSPMRLGYVVGTYPLVSTTFIARELAALRSYGHSTSVLSVRRPEAQERSSDPEAEGSTVSYLLPVSPGRFLACHLAWAIRRPRAYLGTLVWLLTRPHQGLRHRLRTGLHFGEGVVAAAHFERADVELIHAHFVDRAAVIALVAGRLLGVPYSVTAHANDIYRAPVLLPEKLGEAAFAVTVSEANRRHLLDACPDLAPDDLHVIHGWVDAAAWQPSPDRSHDGRIRVVSVGRLVEKKGHADLITACARLIASGLAIECDIVGEGPLRTQLQDRIHALGVDDHVRLLGSRTGDEVRALLDRADLFVLACVVATDGDRDGMPVALAEAMAMGLPVVSTSLPGIEELVGPGVGLLVPQRDPSALADAMASIATSSPAERVAMGSAGRATVMESFIVAAGAERLAALFRTALGPPAKAPAMEGDQPAPATSGAARR